LKAITKDHHMLNGFKGFLSSKQLSEVEKAMLSGGTCEQTFHSPFAITVTFLALNRYRSAWRFSLT
jgi:hypothetical protein